MKLESTYSLQENGDNDYWSPAYGIWGVSMICNGTLVMESIYLQPEHYLPVLSGQECSILIEPIKEWILVFSEANLASL